MTMFLIHGRVLLTNRSPNTEFALTCDNQDGVMFRISSGPFEVEPDSNQRDSRRKAKGSLRRASYD
jgi:hypothetical protein